MSEKLTGILRWNEIEGGFWALDLEDEHVEYGHRVVLTEFDPPQDAVDGTKLEVTGEARPDEIDFLMSGTRFAVNHARIG